MISNPILRKELLIRMRLRSLASAKAGVIVCVLFLIAWVYYEFIVNMLNADTLYRGRDEWGWLIVGQAAILFLLTPVAAANAITQEKEQQTWEMLVFTRLTSGEIIFGKLLARLVPAFAFLLIGFPLTAFAWIVARQHQDQYYKLHFGHFVACYAVLIISSIFFTIIGLFLSWLVKRTLFAVMGAYTAVVGFLMIGTGLIGAAVSMFIRTPGEMDWFPLFWINPVILMKQAFDPSSPAGFVYMLFGLGIYVVLSLVMLAIMQFNFHRSSNAVGG